MLLRLLFLLSGLIFSLFLETRLVHASWPNICSTGLTDLLFYKAAKPLDQIFGSCPAPLTKDALKTINCPYQTTSNDNCQQANGDYLITPACPQIDYLCVKKPTIIDNSKGSQDQTPSNTNNNGVINNSPPSAPNYPPGTKTSTRFGNRYDLCSGAMEDLISWLVSTPPGFDMKSTKLSETFGKCPPVKSKNAVIALGCAIEPSTSNNYLLSCQQKGGVYYALSGCKATRVPGKIEGICVDEGLSASKTQTINSPPTPPSEPINVKVPSVSESFNPSSRTPSQNWLAIAYQQVVDQLMARFRQILATFGFGK